MERADTMDQYLLRLSVALSRVFPNDEDTVLRILSETADHLRQAVDRKRDAGMEQGDAESEAIRQFGSPETVADRFGRELGGALSLRELVTRSYLHLGSFIGALVASAGIACLILSAAAAHFEPRAVRVARYPAQGFSYFHDPWPMGPMVSHMWLTVAGAATLAVGAALWGAHQALLRRQTDGWRDQSLPARAHAVLGVLFFGLAGLAVGPISTYAVFSRELSIQPPIIPHRWPPARPRRR